MHLNNCYWRYIFSKQELFEPFTHMHSTNEVTCVMLVNLVFAWIWKKIILQNLKWFMIHIYYFKYKYDLGLCRKLFFNFNWITCCDINRRNWQCMHIQGCVPIHMYTGCVPIQHILCIIIISCCHQKFPYIWK